MSTRPPELVVRGGLVVDARWSGPADILIAEGRIQALTEPGAPVPTSTAEIDASGQLVLPGGVDPHCHVGFTSGEFTSLDNYAECTTAALLGGTTTIIDFAIPRPGEVPAEVAWAQSAKAPQGLCDSALHACVTQWDETIPQQLAALAAAGVRTVKMFTTYRGESMADDDTILRVMAALRDVDGMAIVHCEANHIIEDNQQACAASGRIDAEHMAQTRPSLAETAAVAEILATAEFLRSPIYFVHQSTAPAVELVAAARRRGISAFSETVAHHLVLDDSRYAEAEPERFVCCPPLRTRSEVDALSRHLFTGEITTIGSDHCCYDLAQKRSHRDDVRAMPNGLPGVETRLTTIFSEYVVGAGLPVTRFVELTSTNPAKTNGIYPRKGSLQPGSDADVVIWNPRRKWTIDSADLHMATDYTPYQGMTVTGQPVTVIFGGRVVVSDGRLIDPVPHGRAIPAGPISLTPALA